MVISNFFDIGMPIYDTCKRQKQKKRLNQAAFLMFR